MPQDVGDVVGADRDRDSLPDARAVNIRSISLARVESAVWVDMPDRGSSVRAVPQEAADAVGTGGEGDGLPSACTVNIGSVSPAGAE